MSEPKICGLEVKSGGSGTVYHARCGPFFQWAFGCNGVDFSHFSDVHGGLTMDAAAASLAIEQSSTLKPGDSLEPFVEWIGEDGDIRIRWRKRKD